MGKLELFDTHCHLYLDEFKADRKEVILRAIDAGVTRICMPGLDSHHVEAMLQLEKEYPEICLPMMGIHPCYIKENFQAELAILEEWLQKRSFWAVGEIGLDYYWDKTYVDQQKTAFHEQIRLAKKAGLPIVVHSRNSMDDCIQILAQHQGQELRGIFHCFSGTAQNATDIIACGLKLGIGGVVTYKNAGLAEVVAGLPLEHIVLETDAPYLSPVPFRGKRNESSYLMYIIQKIASLKNMHVEEVARITTTNAKNIFGNLIPRQVNIH